MTQTQVENVLWFCYRRNPRATAALQDCLAVQHAKWIAHRWYRGLKPHLNSAADSIPPQATTSFARHPGKQRGALRRFDKIFGSEPSTASAAMLPGSPVNRTQASVFSRVAAVLPASQPTSSQLEPVPDRRPWKRKGIKSSA